MSATCFLAGAAARIKRVECDEAGGQFKAPFKKYRVILDNNGSEINMPLGSFCAPLGDTGVLPSSPPVSFPLPASGIARLIY